MKTKIKSETKKNIESTKIEPTYIADTFHRYMRAYHIDNNSVGTVVDASPAAVSYKLSRPDGLWRVDEIVAYCAATKCPFDIILEAQRLGMSGR